MTRPTPTRARRIAVAAVASLATALPLAAVSTPSDARPAQAAEAHKPAVKKKKKAFQHRAKIGAQIVRAKVLDQTPGIEGGKVIDLRVGRASSKVNTRAEFPVQSTSKSLGGRGLADTDLSALLTALVVKLPNAVGSDEIPTQTLVPVPANPLLSLGVSTGETKGRWGGPKRCVTGAEPITSSASSTADLALLPDAIPGVGGLVGLSGTASAIQSTNYLPAGKRAGLTGTATTSLADLSLFGGMVNVNVVSDPVMKATATGKPGGADIEYTPAVLEITGPGGAGIPIPTDGAPAEIAIPANPLLGLTIQFPGILKEKVTENGRMAKAKSVALRVVLELGGQVIADVAVAPLQTKVKVPKGGIACR